MTFWTVLAALIIGAVCVALVRAAPDKIIPPDWKGYISYALLIFVVLYLLFGFFGWPAFFNTPIGRRG